MQLGSEALLGGGLVISEGQASFVRFFTRDRWKRESGPRLSS